MLTRTTLTLARRSTGYIRMYSTATEPFVLASKNAANNVAILTLNRPKALNALSSPLFEQLNAELAKADADDSIKAIVLTGGDKVFAAGADIKEMKDQQFADVYKNDMLGSWKKVSDIRKPIVGAVAGYALGGGSELAMLTDILIVTPNATFSQPEITLGIIPGGGGTQRLVNLLGKARAMDIVLTGRRFSGTEAAEWGLASRVTKEGESVVEEATKVAEKIASFSRIASQAGKEAVNGALELPLGQGLRLERRLFHQLFATQDQKEGMAAFVEKRKPTWTDQ